MANIFLVEDDLFINDIIETKLTKVGHNVTSTADGESVVSSLLENKPDIMLLDLMLPNKHGFDILSELRTHESLKNLPVIVLSNETGSDVEEKAKAMNASYFFKAMTDMDQLVKIIDKNLSST